MTDRSLAARLEAWLNPLPTCALMAGIALAQFGSDEITFTAGNDLIPKALTEFVKQGFIAPQIARFENAGADRHVVARACQAIGDRACRMTHHQAHIPQHIKLGIRAEP